MLTLGIIAIIIIGFLAVNVISLHFSWSEKIGLSFLVGIGLQTIMMLIINLFGVRLTVLNLLFSAVVLIIALLIPLYFKKKELAGYYKKSIRFDLSGYNFIWLLFIVVIMYLEYMNFAKCMYFPTFDRDSLAGFDTIGYVIAREHTFKGLSLFQESYMPSIHGPGSYITYAPMVQLSYAFLYILGAETSKLIPALMYLFFLIAFYGSVQRTVGKTGAAIATFFMMITPEMIAFSSLSATNVIHAVCASLGVIYVALWFRFRERKDLYLGSLLLALNMWIRTDGVVFIGAAIFVVAVSVIRTKQWKKDLIPLFASFIPALLWMFFAKLSNFYAESIAILYPYWDGEKAGIIWKYMKSHYMNTQFYGWTFIVFIASLLLNGWYLIRKKDNLALLTMIVAASVLYMIALYQIDYKWDTIQNVMSYSAKRFMFCFIPMVWFYIVSNQTIKIWFNKLDVYIYPNRTNEKIV